MKLHQVTIAAVSPADSEYGLPDITFETNATGGDPKELRFENVAPSSIRGVPAPLLRAALFELADGEADPDAAIDDLLDADHALYEVKRGAAVATKRGPRRLLALVSLDAIEVDAEVQVIEVPIELLDADAAADLGVAARTVVKLGGSIDELFVSVEGAEDLVLSMSVKSAASTITLRLGERYSDSDMTLDLEVTWCRGRVTVRRDEHLEVLVVSGEAREWREVDPAGIIDRLLRLLEAPRPSSWSRYRRGQLVSVLGATGLFVGLSGGGVPWICYGPDADTYRGMCLAFDHLQEETNHA